MRWGQKFSREWAPWYAWRPVRLNQETSSEHYQRYVWLEVIRRRRSFAGGRWEFAL